MTLGGVMETWSPVERVELFNGERLAETLRPFEPADLGARLRVLWEGAEYRGRFRQVVWDGGAEVSGNEIVDATPVNFLNRDKKLTRDGNDLSWEALTTGNFGGVDIRLLDAKGGRLKVETPLIDFDLAVKDIEDEDHVFDASERLPRFIRVFRLPDELTTRSFRFSVPIELLPSGDNPIHLRLTQEDGTRAWTSPIYVFR